MYMSIFFYLLPTDVEIVVKARCVVRQFSFVAMDGVTTHIMFYLSFIL